MESVPVLFTTKTSCCGCSACYSICPVKAIEMKPDEEGFLYPEIDENKCIRCYRCLSVCALKGDIKNQSNTVNANGIIENKPFINKVYGARIRDRQVLMSSSSGGVFTAFSDVFLTQDNAIVCSTYNFDSHQQEFRLIESFEDRDKARGSKYIQAFPGNIFSDAEKWLKTNPDRKIMFFGVGCQAAAFKSYADMKGFTDQVTIIDLICHGVPSPLIWKDYVRTIEDKYGKINQLNFRDKTNGWAKSKAFVEVDNKKISIQEYRRIYSGRYTYRLCCHKCPYTKTERSSDMTIGDFWHIEEKRPEQFDDLGTSLIIIHTEKGMELFEQAKSRLIYFESDLKECLQYNLERPTEISPKRDLFWKDYRIYGIDFIMKKYGNESLYKKIKRKIKSLIIQK